MTAETLIELLEDYVNILPVVVELPSGKMYEVIDVETQQDSLVNGGAPVIAILLSRTPMQ
jgi:hypothetical protein